MALLISRGQCLLSALALKSAEVLIGGVPLCVVSGSSKEGSDQTPQ